MSREVDAAEHGPKGRISSMFTSLQEKLSRDRESFQIGAWYFSDIEEQGYWPRKEDHWPQCLVTLNSLGVKYHTEVLCVL